MLGCVDPACARTRGWVRDEQYALDD